MARHEGLTARSGCGLPRAWTGWRRRGCPGPGQGPAPPLPSSLGQLTHAVQGQKELLPGALMLLKGHLAKFVSRRCDVCSPLKTAHKTFQLPKS